MFQFFSPFSLIGREDASNNFIVSRFYQIALWITIPKVSLHLKRYSPICDEMLTVEYIFNVSFIYSNIAECRERGTTWRRVCHSGNSLWGISRICELVGSSEWITRLIIDEYTGFYVKHMRKGASVSWNELSLEWILSEDKSFGRLFSAEGLTDSLRGSVASAEAALPRPDGMLTHEEKRFLLAVERGDLATSRRWESTLRYSLINIHQL